MKCPVCGGKTGRFLVKNEIMVNRCLNCGLAFAVGNFQNVETVYDKAYYDRYESYFQWNPEVETVHNRRLSSIEKHIELKGKLLDVGCATGHFLKIARERGWEVKGVEISAFSVDQARKQYRLDVQTGTLETVNLPDNFFDVVTMWDVLEHLPDPMKTITEARQILKKGGVLALSTVNIASLNAWLQKEKWRYLYPPEHLFYFTPKSLKKILHDYKFSNLSFKTHFALHAVIESIQNEKNKQDKMLNFAQEYLKPLKKIRDGLLKIYPFGDIIEVIARKLN